MSEVKIKFTKANDYRIIAATGAWGGVSPHGEICFDLYVEKLEIPDTVQIKVEPNRSVQELSREGEMQVREMQVGVILRPDIAHGIGKWLMAKAKEAGFSEVEIKGIANA